MPKPSRNYYLVTKCMRFVALAECVSPFTDYNPRSYCLVLHKKIHCAMSRMGACAEEARSSIHLTAIFQRPPLGKPPGRPQPWELVKPPAVSVHLLLPAGLWMSSPSALLSRILRTKNLMSRVSTVETSHMHDQAGA